MAIVKKRNEVTENRLQLESDEPVELPPATVSEEMVGLQFEPHRAHVPELLTLLREGTTAHLVPVMRDGSTFALHGPMRTFWVKLWYTDATHTTLDRVRVMSCLPSQRYVRVQLSELTDE